MAFGTTEFWIAFAQIVWIDLLLSGDNAVVIALAVRSLPPAQRRWGMIIGAGVAVGLRVLFAGITTTLLTVPFLKLIGALLLLWVAVKLIVPEDEQEHSLEPADNLWRAIRTIAIADAVMSLDNVIAIAGAAKGSVFLIAFGLALSIPLIIAGSALLTAIIDRFPLIVWAGAALLGFIAGELFVTDPFIHGLIPAASVRTVEWVAAVLGALLPVAIGGWIVRRRAERPDAATPSPPSA